VALHYAKWRSDTESELDALWNAADDVSAAAFERAEAKALAEKNAWDALSEVERRRITFQKEKARLADTLGDQLAALGVKAEEVSVGRIDAVEHARVQKLAHATALKAALDAYGSCCKVLVGIERITLHSGKVKLAVTFDSCSIFADVLP